MIDTSIDKLLKTSVIAKPQLPHICRIENHFICQIHPQLLLFPSLAHHFLFPYDFPYFTEEKETPPIEDKKKTLKTTEKMEKLKKPTTCIDYIKCIKMLVCQANNKCGK